MAEYVIIDSGAPGEVLAEVTVDDDSGVALVHDMVGGEPDAQFASLDQVRQVLAFMRPTYEVREATPA